MREFKHERHSAIVIYAPADLVNDEDVARLLPRLSQEFEAEFALAHLLTREQAESAAPNVGGFADTAGKVPVLTVTSLTLRTFLPDVYWATVFGPPYVSLFGTDRLLSAPAFVVREIGPRTAYLQATGALADVRRNPKSFETVRYAIKNHLNPNAFWHRGDWNLTDRYVVPAEFEQIEHEPDVASYLAASQDLSNENACPED